MCAAIPTRALLPCPCPPPPCSVYTNTQTLKHANVETVIVFRSTVPLFTAAVDHLARSAPLPSPRGWLGILTIILGATGYVLSDSAFHVTAYSWACAYVFVMTIDLVYIKSIVSSIGLDTWGLMLYNNVGALAFFPLTFWMSGELKEVGEFPWDAEGTAWGVAVPVGLSCLVGCAISFFGFACRTATSATSFGVLGVINKIAAVLLNVLLWERHASGLGIFFILLSIAGGVLYQQDLMAKGSHLQQAGGKQEGAAERERDLESPSRGSPAGTK